MSAPHTFGIRGGEKPARSRGGSAMEPLRPRRTPERSYLASKRRSCDAGRADVQTGPAGGGEHSLPTRPWSAEVAPATAWTSRTQRAGAAERDDADRTGIRSALRAGPPVAPLPAGHAAAGGKAGAMR